MTIAVASLNTCKAEIHISCGTPKLHRPNTPSFLHLLLWLLSCRTVHQSQGHQAIWLPRKIAVCSLLFWSISWRLCMWLNTWSYPGMSDKRKCFPFLTCPQILHLFSISIYKNTFFLKKKRSLKTVHKQILFTPPCWWKVTEAQYAQRTKRRTRFSDQRKQKKERKRKSIKITLPAAVSSLEHCAFGISVSGALLSFSRQ